jgi:hypothetical protein
MEWFEPQWFSWQALVAEWRRKDVRRALLGFATAIVVLCLFAHPSTAPTAIYIDSVGIDVFLGLLELQLVVSLLLFREQLVSTFHAVQMSDDLLGKLVWKLTALTRWQKLALTGAFRE